MTPADAALLRRIAEFPIDGPDAPALPFAARLARKHGWTPAHAGRVLGEYKRFVFLAVTAGRPVCPSEDVDAAWHLHLTYTRSYWKRFCGEVLGRELHHDPTRGGAAEAGKHHAMYADTLAAYRAAFGEEPPADVWPTPEVRFGDDTQQRVVNTARNWVVPKAWARRAAAGVAVAGVAVVTGTGCGGGLNPFALVGTEFLAFLIPILVGAAVTGRVIRSMMRSPGPQPTDDDLNPGWETAAFLAGGFPRLTTAAIARLAERKLARVPADRTRLEPGDAVAHDLSAVERAVYDRLPVQNTPADLKAVQAAVEIAFGAEAARLDADGFTLGRGRQAAAGFLAGAPVLAVIMFLAVPRLGMGLAAGKPVGLLIATMVVGGVLGIISASAGSSLRRSRRGDETLARLQARHAGLKAAAGGDAGMAVGLFGPAVLTGTAVAYMLDWYPRPAATGSGCSTGSSGGDGGGGGGGGGCGSGCGGCGGGGGD